MIRARAWLRGGPWRALRSRDFRLLWLGQLVSVTGSQMRIVAIAWQVYLVRSDPLQLGILGLTQAVALIIFSLVAGVVADVFDRRQLLIAVNATLACGSLTLALATQFQVISLPLIYTVAFLMAAVSAFDYPARQALIPSLVTAAELPDALAINSLVFNLASIVGPTLGGFAIAVAGVTGAYGADASSFLVVTAALLAMRGVKVRGTGARRANPVAAWLDGFAYLRARPVLLGLMALDFCAMFFGSPQALLPIYARDIFHAGPTGLGILSSAGAIGAVAGVFFVARLRGIRRQGIGVLLGVTAWGLCIVLFGLTNGPLWPGQPWQTLSWQGPFWLAFVFLAGAGAADLVSMVLRNVILQLSTPDEMRGRVSATNAIFIIGGPSLGQFESGVVARFLTPQLSALTGGLACLAATGLIALRVPAVRRYHAGMYGAEHGAQTADQPAPGIEDAIVDSAASAAAELSPAD